MPHKAPRPFASLAAAYSRHDFLVREIDGRMQERMDVVRLSPRLILDMGCGCGGSFAGLGARYPEALLLGIDHERAMLEQATAGRAMRVAGNAMALPVADESVDLVWSNLLMHWLDEPSVALAETLRVLGMGGLLMFSTLGPDTLKELRSAFPDDHARTQPFADLHDWGDLLLACGFSDPVMDREDVTIEYGDFDRLISELRHASAACRQPGRRRAGLTGASFWQSVAAAYQRRAGKLSVSFEVIYGHAWKLPGSNATHGGESPLRFYRR